MPEGWRRLRWVLSGVPAALALIIAAIILADISEWTRLDATSAVLTKQQFNAVSGQGTAVTDDRATVYLFEPNTPLADMRRALVKTRVDRFLDGDESGLTEKEQILQPYGPWVDYKLNDRQLTYHRIAITKSPNPEAFRNLGLVAGIVALVLVVPWVCITLIWWVYDGFRQQRTAHNGKP